MSIKHCEWYMPTSYHSGWGQGGKNRSIQWYKKGREKIPVPNANLCGWAYVYIASGWFLLEHSNYWALGLHGILVALKHNHFYVQSVWNNVRGDLCSTKILFLSPGTDVVYDRSWGALVAEDGVVKICIGWREPKRMQSYAHSFSVWSLIWMIPKSSGDALEKTSLKSPGKTWGRKNS